MGVDGSRGALGRSPKNLMIQGMLGINSTQISALKTNTGSIQRMQILRKLAPLLVPRLLSPLSPLGIKNFFGRFLASISAQIWRNITKSTKNLDFKKNCPPCCPPFTCPLAPLGVKIFFGRFLASISAQIWRNITKNTKNAVFKKTVPPAAPLYMPPWPPWRSKKILGGFWHLFQLKC